MLLASEFGTGQVLWSFIWFFTFIIWIWLLLAVFGDIFRSHDIGGGTKAFWVLLVLILPYLGVFIYLIARGHKMGEHAAADAKAQDAAAKAYIKEAAGSSSPADELQRLSDLKAAGTIDDAEFKKLKAKIVG